ncbi:MAG: hypothetical protein ACK5NF_04810 [Bacilli bacterium]
MKKKKISVFFLLFMLNIVLLFYMFVSLERVVYENLNEYNKELEVSMKREEYNTFRKYVEENNFEVEFHAFKDNEYTLFTSNNAKSGCYKQNHFGKSNQYVECELSQNSSSKINIAYTNENSYKMVIAFLNRNNITYEEQSITNFSNSSIFEYFVIVTVVIFLLISYLSLFDNTKEVKIKFINGWSKVKIILESYLWYLKNFIIIGTLISLLSIIVLKLKFSKLSYEVFLNKILVKYLYLLVGINILVLLLIIISVYSILRIKKRNAKSYHKIFIAYVVKTILYITTITIIAVCYIQVVNYSVDKKNLFNYEKFDKYSGYQLSDDQVASTLKKNNNYVYYTSTSPSILDESHNKYCAKEDDNIFYCKAIIGSSKFFEIGTSYKFNSNTLVLPTKYKDYEDDIIKGVKTEYKGLDFDVRYIDNTDIYSYNYYYYNKTNDYIKDGIWLVFNEYHESLYNINTVYSLESMGEEFYKFDNFSDEFRLYLNSIQTQIMSLATLIILQIVLFIFLNTVIIRTTINNKLQIITSQITNGLSYYDIFYIHYSHILVITVVSMAISSYIVKDLMHFSIPLVIGVLLLIGELIVNNVLIKKISKNRIVKYLKGDKL